MYFEKKRCKKISWKKTQRSDIVGTHRLQNDQILPAGKWEIITPSLHTNVFPKVSVHMY